MDTAVKITELYVGGLSPEVDNREVLHSLREFGPLVHISRPNGFLAFVTMTTANAYSAVQYGGFPDGMHVDLARKPKPMHFSIRIDDLEPCACRAHLNGHCSLEEEGCPFRCPHPLHREDVDYITLLSGKLIESGQKKKKRRKLNPDNLRNGNEGATSSGVMPTTVTPTSSFEQKGALQQVGSVDEFTPSSSFEEKGSQSDHFSAEDVTNSSEYENETDPSSQPTEYLDINTISEPTITPTVATENATTSALKPTSVQSAATIIPAASFKQEVDTHNGSNDAFTLICRSKDDSKKKFGDLLKQTKKIYYLHGKGPSTDIEQEQWKVITSVLENWYDPGLSRLLEKCPRFEVFESEDGAATIRFKTLPMTTKSGSGVYCSEVEQDGQVLEYRIGMSDGECYDRVKRDNNNPKQSSHMCITTGEFTKIMEGCNEYEKAVKTVCENCPYFNYETSRSDRREKGVANQLAELLMKALLLKSEDRELTLSRRVNPGIAAERIFALGSKFVRDVCQFSNSSEHEDAVDRLSMADEYTWLLTWAPYSSLLDEDIDRLFESSDDDALQQVIQQVYRGRPTHKFMQKHLMLRLFGEDNSISWRDAVHRSHVHDAVHQVAESMREIIRNEDIDTVSKKYALVEAIQTLSITAPNSRVTTRRHYQVSLAKEASRN